MATSISTDHMSHAAATMASDPYDFGVDRHSMSRTDHSDRAVYASGTMASNRTTLKDVGHCDARFAQSNRQIYDTNQRPSSLPSMYFPPALTDTEALYVRARHPDDHTFILDSEAIAALYVFDAWWAELRHSQRFPFATVKASLEACYSDLARLLGLDFVWTRKGRPGRDLMTPATRQRMREARDRYKEWRDEEARK